MPFARSLAVRTDTDNRVQQFTICPGSAHRPASLKIRSMDAASNRRRFAFSGTSGLLVVSVRLVIRYLLAHGNNE